MAKKKASPVKRIRRSKIAKAIVKGESVTRAAKEAGTSRATAYRDACSEEVRYEIARVLDRKHEQLDALLDRALRAIAEAFEAERLVILTIRSGDESRQRPVRLRDENLRADHAVRVKAVAQLARLLILGRPQPTQPHVQDRPITYEQFRQLLESYEKEMLR